MKGSNLTFAWNEADSGGALWSGDFSVSEMKDCYFVNNQAPRTGGGSISLAGFSSLQIIKGAFSHNSGGEGGAILAAENSLLFMDESVFVYVPNQHELKLTDIVTTLRRSQVVLCAS